MRNVRIISILLGAAGIVLLAGCGSDTPSGSSSSSAQSSSARTSSTASAASSSTATSTSSTSNALDAGLLTATEVGTGFAVQPQFDNPDDPLPCTPKAKPLFDQIKPQERSDISFTNPDGPLVVGEIIARYDEADAKAVFAAAIKGFDCSTATIGGTEITVAKRGEPTKAGEVESASWDISGGEQVGTAAILRIGGKVAGMTFVATTASASKIDVQQTLAKAAEKIAALP